MTRLRHYDHLGTARFITFSCYRRHQLLTEVSLISAFLSELSQLRVRRVKIIGYVVMLEHVHLVLLPPETMQLGREIGRLKSLSARRILALSDQLTSQLARFVVRRDGESRRVFWQRRCYDHNCRTPETVREKIEYCHKNPVIRGLVRAPEDWPWSSYRWYMGLDGIELEIDGLEV